MPSGAKKRRAAKKKKLQQQQQPQGQVKLSDNKNPHGTKEVKSGVQPENNGAETSLLVSEDQQQSKNQSGDVEKAEPRIVQSSDNNKEGKPSDERVTEDDKALKSDGRSNIDVSTEYLESVKESHDGKENNLDQESQVAEKTSKGKVDNLVEALNSAKGVVSNDVSTLYDESAKELQDGKGSGSRKNFVEKAPGADKRSKEEAENSVEALNSVKLSVTDDPSIKYDESAKELHDGKDSSSRRDSLDKVTQLADKRPKEVANSLVHSISKEVDVTEKATIVEVTDLVLDKAPVESVKQVVPASNEVIPVPESAAKQKSSSVSNSVESSLKNTEEKTSPKPDGVTGVSLAEVESSAAKTEEKVSTTSDVTVQASSTKASVPNEKEAKLSSGARSTEINGADTAKECHGRCEDQPSAPPAAEKAKWWNCCGLFDH